MTRIHALAAVTALSLLFHAAPARAQYAGGRETGFLLRMNLDWGGDEVITVRYSDGSEKTIKAGQLATLAAGAIYHPAAPWALEGTIGYKFDQATGSNGTIKFTRIPLDVIASYVPVRGLRLGAGPTLHLSPKFSCDADGLCAGSTTLNNALGGVFQIAYGHAMGNAGLDVGLRYTLITYKKAGYESLDGSAFGFFFGGWL